MASKSYKSGYVSTVAVLLAFSVLAAFNYGAIQAKAAPDDSEDKSLRVLTLIGISSLRISPDLVVISLGVETKSSSAEEALRTNSEFMNRAIEALKKIGIPNEEISTSRVQLYPDYIYDRHGVAMVTGYRAINVITVKSKQLEKAGHIIDATVREGVNRVESVYFTLTDEGQKSLRKNLLGLAVKDALDRAQSTLEPLGMRVIGVVNISINDGYYPPIRLEAQAVKGSDGMPTPVIPGEQTVTASVSITFEIGT